MVKKMDPTEAAKIAAALRQERSKFVETLAGYGMEPVEIGLLMVPALSEEQVRLEFATELELGPTKANLETVTILRGAVKKGHVGAAIYWTKARMGWTEKGPVEKGELEPGDREKPTGLPTSEQLLKSMGISILRSRSKRSRGSSE